MEKGSDLLATYHGCGLVRCKPGMEALNYVGDEGHNPASDYDDDADAHLSPHHVEAAHPGAMVAIASATALVAEEGTALAAYLNATGGKL